MALVPEENKRRATTVEICCFIIVRKVDLITLKQLTFKGRKSVGVIR